MKKKRAAARVWHSRTDRDLFIVRIRGWGKMENMTRGYACRFPASYGHPERYFSIQKYGDAGALGRARAYRDSLYDPRTEPVRRQGKDRSAAAFQRKPRKGNTSGITGLTFDARHGGMWVAYYHPRPGVQKRRAWAIGKYTNEGAKMLAIAWRADMLAGLRRKR